jgi:hypothetical protein
VTLRCLSIDLQLWLTSGYASVEFFLKLAVEEFARGQWAEFV